MSRSIYLCRIYKIYFSFVASFSVINHITSSKQTHFFLSHFLEYLLADNVDEESEYFQIAKFSLEVLLNFINLSLQKCCLKKKRATGVRHTNFDKWMSNITHRKRVKLSKVFHVQPPSPPAKKNSPWKTCSIRSWEDLPPLNAICKPLVSPF